MRCTEEGNGIRLLRRAAAAVLGMSLAWVPASALALQQSDAETEAMVVEGAQDLADLGEEAEGLSLNEGEYGSPSEPAATELAALEGDDGQEHPTEVAGDTEGLIGSLSDDEAADQPAQDSGIPLPDNAVEVAEGTYVIESNVSNEKVVDAAGENPGVGSNVATWTYHGGQNQRWDVRKDAESGWYRIFLSGSEEKALGVKSTEANPYNVAIVDAADSGDGSLWGFIANGTWYNLLNRATSLCLDVNAGSKDNGANLQVADKSSTSAKQQRFYLLSTSPVVEPDATVKEAAYAMSPSSNTGVVVEARGAKEADGTNVWLYSSNGKSHQKIYLENRGDNYYVAWVVGTGKALSQEKDSLIPGTNVVQKAYKGLDTQLWAITAHGSSYSLVNKASGLALGFGSAKSGSNVAMTRNDGYKTTLFSLARKPLLSAGIYEIHPRTSKAVSLDVQKAAASGDANLLLWTDSNRLNQRFELVSAGSTDLWRIRTASSGGWVTDTGAGIQQSGKGATALTAANSWRVTFKGGWFSLINKGSGQAMDMRRGKTSSGTSIIRYQPNGRDSQHFTFEPSTLLVPGCYFFKNGLGTYLDIARDSAAAGANVQAWAKDGGLGQYFTLERSGSAYRIQNTYSGKYLTAAGTANSSNVTQRASSGSNAQKWKAVIADGGMVSFVGLASNKALDVKRNSAANGANVQVYTINQGKGQVWKPVKTSYHPFSGYVLRAVNRANASSSSTGYLLVVDKSAHRVIAMVGENGHWRPSKDMACSVGAYATPTVEGSFVVQSRGYSFGSGYTCYYWTQFYQDYLFHSITYNEGTRDVQDGRLGMHISHGCVRMPINDAYWIYSTIPSGTRVLIYS